MAAKLKEYERQLKNRYILAQQKKEIRQRVSSELAERGIDTPTRRAQIAQALQNAKRDIQAKEIAARHTIAEQRLRIQQIQRAKKERLMAEVKEKKRRKFDIYKTTAATARDYETERAYKHNLKYIKQQERFRDYDKTGTGKIGKFLGKALQAARPGGMTRALYSRQTPMQPRYANKRGIYSSGNTVSPYSNVIRRGSGGRVGRPVGTYKQMYAQWGGVYGYRKMLAAKYRAERIRLQQQANISPQQQMVINRYQSQQQYQQMNPESQIVPNTYGNIPLNDIFNDIDRAINLVD